MKTAIYLLLLVLCTFTLAAQEAPAGMVPIPGGEVQASPDKIKTNDENLQPLLKEFFQSARYYRVKFTDELLNIKAVYLVKADLNFLGAVAKGGDTIYLNAELANYENLGRVVLFRQLGKIHGLKEETGHHIMGEHWKIDLQHELLAYNMRTRSHAQKRIFFEALAAKHPLKKRL